MRGQDNKGGGETSGPVGALIREGEASPGRSRRAAAADGFAAFSRRRLEAWGSREYSAVKSKVAPFNCPSSTERDPFFSGKTRG